MLDKGIHNIVHKFVSNVLEIVIDHDLYFKIKLEITIQRYYN